MKFSKTKEDIYVDSCIDMIKHFCQIHSESNQLTSMIAHTVSEVISFVFHNVSEEVVPIPDSGVEYISTIRVAEIIREGLISEAKSIEDAILVIKTTPKASKEMQ